MKKIFLAGIIVMFLAMSKTSVNALADVNVQPTTAIRENTVAETVAINKTTFPNKHFRAYESH